MARRPQSQEKWTHRIHETGSDGGGEDEAESHGQGSTHVEELVAGGRGCDGGQASDHAGGVPSSPDQNGAAQEADGCNDGAENHAVADPKRESNVYQ